VLGVEEHPIEPGCRQRPDGIRRSKLKTATAQLYPAFFEGLFYRVDTHASESYTRYAITVFDLRFVTDPRPIHENHDPSTGLSVVMSLSKDDDTVPTKTASWRTLAGQTNGCLGRIPSMKHLPHLVLGTAGLVCLLGASSLEADWPNWRGPNATGVAPDRTLPIKWSATENVAWKAPIAGAGVSTPIVSGDRVYVTSQIGAGIRREGNHPRLVQGADAAAQGERALGVEASAGVDPSKTYFVVEAFSRADGKRIWERRIEATGDLTPVHDKHNLATPSPVTDGALVFAWFGTGQIVALDRAGAVVWQRHLAKENGAFDIQWGHGSSPVLHGDLLILLCDQPARSYLLAIDKKTGKDRWKADRGQGRSSYSTPLVIEGAFGTEVIVNSTERIDAYDGKTGAFLWHAGESSRFAVPTPVFHEGVIYASRGYRSGPYMAIKPGGRGDVTSTQMVWRIATGAPYCSSLLYYDRVVYMANDVGVLTAVDAASGERVWQERVDGVFSASPVAGGGHVYFVSENGETVVLKAGRAPQVVARNALGERAVASPAISNGQIFIRTDKHVFAIGGARGTGAPSH
jgi:outer membrane protein assembly factor BamB